MSGEPTLADVWARYWEEYTEDKAHTRFVQEVAADYPVSRGLPVSYSRLLDMGITHTHFKTHPDEVLGAGVEAFQTYIRETEDVDDAWEGDYSAIILHLEELPDGFKVWDYSRLEDHLNELVQVTVTVDSEPENKADMMEAAFVCVHDHVTRVHQAGRRYQQITQCPDCGESVYLDPKRSMFTRIQRATVAGEGFSDVLCIIGGSRSMSDDLRKGDRITLNAIPRADIRGDSTHGDVHMDVLTLLEAEE